MVGVRVTVRVGRHARREQLIGRVRSAFDAGARRVELVADSRGRSVLIDVMNHFDPYYEGTLYRVHLERAPAIFGQLLEADAVDRGRRWVVALEPAPGVWEALHAPWTAA